mmetsp:Transcript_2240/g.6759  ORF Transcript_2240/g.6759 Transcript_2240/m.6759 type:complete len:210 (+) Transcript_2240:162-791(+)
MYKRSAARFPRPLSRGARSQEDRVASQPSALGLAAKLPPNLRRQVAHDRRLEDRRLGRGADGSGGRADRAGLQPVPPRHVLLGHALGRLPIPRLARGDPQGSCGDGGAEDARGSADEEGGGGEDGRLGLLRLLRRDNLAEGRAGCEGGAPPSAGGNHRALERLPPLVLAKHLARPQFERGGRSAREIARRRPVRRRRRRRHVERRHRGD